jgi:surface antigen
MKKIFLLSSMALLISGCDKAGQIGGQLAGAGVGGLIGSQIGGGSARIWTGIAGAILGGLFGGMLGSKLDEQDKNQACQAAGGALSSGQTVVWQNPQTGHKGQVVPAPVYYKEGRKCRRFTHLVELEDGTPAKVEGRACQDTNGTWQIVAN